MIEISEQRLIRLLTIAKGEDSAWLIKYLKAMRQSVAP